MIDKSHSMTELIGTKNRLSYAIKAAQAIILSSNPNDHVCPLKRRYLTVNILAGSDAAAAET